jgi:propanol-preferring alcohol dehydrogenase
MVGSLEASGLRAGQWAVFPGGGGGVGIQGVQIAKAMGLRAIVIDTGASKKKLALEMGAEAFIDFKEVSDIPEEVKKLADGIGAHGVFVTAVQAYGNAPDLVGDRVGAKIMCLGLPTGGTVQVTAEPSWFILKNRSIIGTLVGTQEDTRKALDYAKRGLLKQVCEVYPIDKIGEAVDKLRSGQVAGRVVVDFNQ